jgi:hypothetical protein
VGTSPLVVTGNPGTHTLTWSTDGTVATSYVENSGTAVPSAGVLNVLGGTGVTTVGVGNTITINAGASVPLTFTEDAGTATPVANNLNIFGSAGITTSGAGSTVTITAGGTIATTYVEDSGSATPSANTLDIVGGAGISTSGATNVVTISASSDVPLTFHTDAGDAVPALNAITVHGTGGISTSGAGSTITINNSGSNPGVAKAWVTFDKNGVIAQQFNVSSVNHTGVGTYTVNFTTPLSNANYAISGSVDYDYGVGLYSICFIVPFYRTVNNLQMGTFGSGGSSFNSILFNLVSVIFFDV